MKIEKIGCLMIMVCAFHFNVGAQTIAGGSDGVIYLNPLGGAESNNFKKGTYIGPHFLGDSITVKKDYFERQYIYYKKGNGAYAVEEKVVKKPAIYKAIQKVDDALTKEAMENLQRISDNRARIEKIYDIGIKLSRFQTAEVEKALKKLKTPKDIEQYLLSLKYNN